MEKEVLVLFSCIEMDHLMYPWYTLYFQGQLSIETTVTFKLYDSIYRNGVSEFLQQVNSSEILTVITAIKMY